MLCKNNSTTPIAKRKESRKRRNFTLAWIQAEQNSRQKIGSLKGDQNPRGHVPPQHSHKLTPCVILGLLLKAHHSLSFPPIPFSLRLSLFLSNSEIRVCFISIEEEEQEQEKQRTGRKMSWQTYIDEHLMCEIEGTNHRLTAAAILGIDGSMWAQSASFPQVSDSINRFQGVYSLFH